MRSEAALASAAGRGRDQVELVVHVGHQGSRVKPVAARQPSIRRGRYWIFFSLRLMMRTRPAGACEQPLARTARQHEPGWIAAVSMPKTSSVASRLYAASMAFALISGARHSLRPPSRTGPLTTPQASRHATDRIVAPPYRAFDAGLRPGPFPGRAASLLPGLLAATRTGFPPAGDDELTNSKKHHGLTSRCHLLLCWAHE
jgi:hypothetical protein